MTRFVFPVSKVASIPLMTSLSSKRLASDLTCIIVRKGLGEEDIGEQEVPEENEDTAIDDGARTRGAYLQCPALHAVAVVGGYRGR